MAAGYVGSGDLMVDAENRAWRHRVTRGVLSISFAFLLIGALSACGKRGELQAPPSSAETVSSPNEESTE